MNEDVVDIMYKEYWTPRRKLMLKLAIFYFVIGVIVGALIW